MNRLSLQCGFDGAYGHAKKQRLFKEIRQSQSERLLQISKDNGRLVELGKEKRKRQRLLKLLWGPADSSSVCQRRHQPVSVSLIESGKNEKKPNILQSIEAKAAFYESELLKKMHFLRNQADFPHLTLHKKCKSAIPEPERNHKIGSEQSYALKFRLLKEQQSSHHQSPSISLQEDRFVPIQKKERIHSSERRLESFQDLLPVLNGKDRRPKLISKRLL